MKLTDDVYLVGGGHFAFDLSSPFDCHIYCVRSGDELALIDAGTGMGMDDVVAAMRADGLDPMAVRAVFVTHYHADHAGGARRWHDLGGARVHASAVAAAALRAGNADVIGLRAAQVSGIYPADYVFASCPVDEVLEDGATVAIGSLRLTAYASPGHCDGHLVYLLEGGERSCLFAGDCVLWGGTIILQNIPDCRIPEYAATMERLAGLHFEALLPGHLTITLREGKRHVDTAVAAFRGLGLPRNAVQL